MNIKVSVAFGIISFLLIFSSFMVPSTHAVTLDLQARDCDDNAVIRCGAASTSELLQKYNSQTNNTDRDDARTDVQELYSSFGISTEEMEQIGSTAVAGIVNRDGNVTVNGRVVATGAMTAGRQNISGSTPISAGDTQFYKRSPSVSFKTDRLKAFVVMRDSNSMNNSGGASGDRDNSQGKRFAFAIIASCGNPVTAQPKTPPQPAPAKPVAKTKPQPQPAPQPAPAPQPQEQTQTQSQQQSATANATATVTVNQEKVAPPAPAPAPPQTVVERVEVPVVVPQPAAAAPAPVAELPKTGMESASSTLGLTGVAVLLGTVAHYLFSRRSRALQK